jgi:hypothetical protein
MDEKEIENIVNQFCTSYEAGLIVSNAQGLEYVQENLREPDCDAWWSALPENVQQKWLANPKTPTISKAWNESQRRLEAVNFSRASMFLSGFEASLEDEALSVRYINGEITISEAIQSLDEQMQRSEFRE